MSDNELIYFEGNVVRKIYEADGFRMYGMSVDPTKYPVKRTQYGSITLKGDLPNLSEGQLYKVKATEEYDSKYGYSYKCVKIESDVPKSESDMFTFLQEILTFRQAAELYREYPDIVDMVRNDEVDKIDISKLKGIGAYTLNNIINKIRENFVFADLITEFHGVFSYSTIIKLYEKYPSIDRIKEVLSKDPYRFLTSIDRIGFKKADQMVLKMEKEGVFTPEEPLINSHQRCMAFIIYTLKENEKEGNTKMSLRKLQNLCKDEVPDCALNFVQCVKTGIIHVDKDDVSVGLQSTFNTEKYLADRLAEGLNIHNVYDFDISKYQKVDDDVQLTDEQMQAVQNLCKHNVSILDGCAGSGKSATTQQIVKMLHDNKKSFILLAPTGRAAKVLSEYTHYTASTIHRGLGYNPKEGWIHCKDNPLSQDVVIVDEFSMVDVFLFKHLLDAIDFNKTKLMIIGDSAQLNSVAAGNCLHDMMDANIIPTTTLTKIFRYGEGGLMKVATDTRLCKPFLVSENIKQKATPFGANKDYVFIKTSNELVINNTISVYEKVLSLGVSPEDILVLSSYNKGDYGTVVLNNKLQKIANPNSRNGSQGFKSGKTIYYRNDLILQTANDYHVKVYDLEKQQTNGFECMICNGEIGKIIEVQNYGVVIKFDHNYVFYNRKSLEFNQLGYAVSIHKCQGGSAKIIILVTPDAHQYMLNSNLLYVGLTRMKEKCYHLGSVSTINRAVKKKENLQRSTYLKSLLMGISSESEKNIDKIRNKL